MSSSLWCGMSVKRAAMLLPTELLPIFEHSSGVSSISVFIFNGKPCRQTYTQFVVLLNFSVVPWHHSLSKNYLSGVKLLHILSGFEYTFSDDFHLHITLRGISRLHPHVPKRARPVTPSILKLFYNHMDKMSSVHWTVYSCGLLLFFTMARLGSVLPTSQDNK